MSSNVEQNRFVELPQSEPSALASAPDDDDEALASKLASGPPELVVAVGAVVPEESPSESTNSEHPAVLSTRRPARRLAPSIAPMRMWSNRDGTGPVERIAAGTSFTDEMPLFHR